jgi:genome maintenance exonuclease 1
MTLIIEKHKYTPIERKSIDGRRKYLTPDGNSVASVTTILDATKDKTHLIAWRKRVGEQKAQEIVTEASSVGTRMHKYLEDYVETGVWPTPGSNPYAQQAHKMAGQVRDKALVDVDEIWGSEVNLYMPQMYAGTTDLVGQYKGNACIMDFKQTNKPKKEEWVIDYYLQLVAYAEAHNEIYGTEIREGHVFMCSRDLQYQQFDVWPHEYAEWQQEWYKRLYTYYEKHTA